MKSIRALLVIALLLGLSACSKDPATNTKETPAAAAAAKNVQTVAPVQAETQQSATADDATTQKPGEATEVTEQVVETDEGVEANDENAKNATPIPKLKLAQLPARVPSTSKFKEGVNYFRLSPTQPVSVSPDQVQIGEFFWYGCPHCNALDPRLESWRNGAQAGGKPDYVVFTRIPAAWNESTRFHGRFYFAAESLGKLEELHPLIFREIHVNGNPLNTLDKAREFFAAHGVDAQAFQKSFGALAIEGKLDEANTLAQRYRLAGVPTFIVNGKFVADVESAGGQEQLFALLNELAAHEHSKE